MLLLPPRRRQPVSRRVGGGQWRCELRARDIDAVLHRERLDGRKKRLHALPMRPEKLPDGAMVQQGDESYLIAQGRALAWSPAGYRAADITALPEPMLLTPPSTLRAFSAAIGQCCIPRPGEAPAA